MVYKHAISTVVPGRPVRLPTAGDAEQSESGNDEVGFFVLRTSRWR